MGIEAVIWDMGGIVYETPFEVFDEVEAERGWEPGTLPRGPFAPAGDADYERCSTGEITESDYWRGYETRLREEQGIELRVRHAIDWSRHLRPEVLDAIARLDGHYLQATLTNDSSTWLGEGWWEVWPYRHLFGAVVDVVTLGVRKPHPRTYLAAAAALATAPERCLFVDDMRVNVAGAEAVGMEGFFFDHCDATGSIVRLLDRLLPDEHGAPGCEA